MRKGTYLLLCVSILVFSGCATKSDVMSITPTAIIGPTDTIPTLTPKPTTKVFQKKKEESSKQSTFSDKVITKTEGLCEELEKLETPIETKYNQLNRMLSVDFSQGGLEGFSYFCIEETTGVIYFVNQSRDQYLYRIKDGEIALALAMPVKEVYPYDGCIYFMVDNSYDKYELQDMKSGDIYCYTPASGAVELVYPAGATENSKRHKLFVDETGIYFSYEVATEDGSNQFFYHLPFGTTEPVPDMEETIIKGWNGYKFSYEPPEYKFLLESRREKGNGTKEEIELSVKRIYFCVIGNNLYSADKTSISCTNLETGETIWYDFLQAMEEMEIKKRLEDGERMIEGFTITEDAIWVTTGATLYRMDLKNGEITFGNIWDNKNFYSVHQLYTDGKEIYGVNFKMRFMETSEKTLVYLLTENMDTTGRAKIGVEFLPE